MVKRKICVLTGTRADYGLLRRLMMAVSESQHFQLQVVATAAHLSPEYGMTYREIEADGFSIDEKVEMLLGSDSAGAVIKSMGLGLIALSDVYQRLQPDLVVILGDRFEALAAAEAALVARIPIAHLHGGELTEGAMDESIRHSITKMSHLHFVATEEYRRRVIQLGEQPERVFATGAIGIDNIRHLRLLNRAELEASLGISFARQNILITYHPTTLAESGASNSMEPIWSALEPFSEACIIVTLPNADPANRELTRQIRERAASDRRIHVFSSLGSQRYLSTLDIVDLVIGNSSSGLLEVPSFHKPTINIGDRQKGRIRAASVIDCDPSSESIAQALEQALSPAFQQRLLTIENPYGSGDATAKIMSVLTTIDFTTLIRKPFYDIEIKNEYDP